MWKKPIWPIAPAGAGPHEWSSPVHVQMDSSLASAGHILLPANVEAFQGWGKLGCWN